MSTAFQAVCKNKKSFGINLYKLASSNCITLDFLVNYRKGVFHNGNENSDMSASERTHIYLLRLLHKPIIGKLPPQWYISECIPLRIHLCRTVRINCWYYSREIVNENLEKGAVTFHTTNFDNRIIACIYCSVKDIVDSNKSGLYVFKRQKSAMVEIAKHDLIRNAVWNQSL